MRDSQDRQYMVALLAGDLGPPLELRLMDEWKVQIHFTQKTSACTNTNDQVLVSAHSLTEDPTRKERVW